MRRKWKNRDYLETVKKKKCNVIVCVNVCIFHASSSSKHLARHGSIYFIVAHEYLQIFNTYINNILQHISHFKITKPVRFLNVILSVANILLYKNEAFVTSAVRLVQINLFRIQKIFFRLQIFFSCNHFTLMFIIIYLFFFLLTLFLPENHPIYTLL